MSAEGQTSGGFLDLLLCLLELPGVLWGGRGEGAESSFRPWSLWTGSVALIAQVTDQMNESTVIPPRRAEGRPPLAESWREAGLRLCTVCLSVFLLSPVILVDLAVLFSLVQRSVLNCIKLYRLCKKTNKKKAECRIAEEKRYSLQMTKWFKMYKRNSEAKFRG